MSVTRTPDKLKTGPIYSGSQPDLSKLHDAPVDSPIAIRKRKQPEYDYDLRQDLKEFRNEFVELFNNFARTQGEQITTLRSDVSIIMDQLSSIKTVNENIIYEHSQLKKEVNDITESLNFHIKSQEDLKTRVDTLSTHSKEVKGLQSEIMDLKQTVNDLQNEQNIQQQKERLLNLEISGIPEKRNENLLDYLVSIANIIGVNLSNEDIIRIHRVQPRIQLPGKPKNIIAHMKSLHIKDTIISGIRKNRGLSTIDLGIPGESRQIYVNEHLSPVYKQLYKNTRDAVKSSNFKYVWIRNCKIYVRKDDTSPAILVKDVNDLRKIK